jgi:hypothetical protein
MDLGFDQDSTQYLMYQVIPIPQHLTLIKPSKLDK